MAKQIKQFRYYSDTDTSKNYPPTLNSASLKEGKIFQNYMPITKLGIQSLPGTKFYLNGSLQPVMVGYTGIYEFDLDGEAEIFSLSFEHNTIDRIQDNLNAYLIIDMIYEGEGDT